MPKQLLSLWLGLFVLLFNITLAHADNHFINRPDVQSFIDNMVRKHHFQRETLIDLFRTVKIRPHIMQSIRVPLEAQQWSTYQKVFINHSHIQEGVAYWERNHLALERAEQTYGVPASIIVATIGVETKYGKNKGEYPVIEALANIAFSESHRAPYFRHELEEFLLLSREQDLNPRLIKGSYAGAIGQPQFMPSSYRNFAINFSGNHHIDLSNNEYDIIGSIANYYQKHGWHYNQAIAIPTIAEPNRYRFLLKNSPKRLLNNEELAEYGLYPSIKVPSNEKFKIIQLQGKQGNEYWVGLNNFEVIKRYNPSNLYAMAVYQLSYYIKTEREKLHHA